MEGTPVIIRTRRRSWLVVAFIFTVLLGLASRRYPLFPTALGKYPGDALWALMVFFAWGFVFPRRPTFQIFLITLAMSFCVEFSKLYRAPWLNDFRDTTIGHLLLGSTFWWQNLVAYAIGAGIGAMVDCALLSIIRDQNRSRDRLMN